MGLLPTSPRFERLRRRLTVDAAAQAGAAFLLLAFVATLGAVGYWSAQGFGPLEPGSITRLAALVAVLAALGVQSVTNGFLWGLMTQKLPAEATPAPVETAAAQIG